MSAPPQNDELEVEGPAPGARRSLVATASTLFMVGGLAAAYGTLAAFMARYLYPAHKPRKRWLYVTDVAALKPGESLSYRTPDGQSVAIARSGRGVDAGDFVALSSVCPHLGCQVHWEPQNNHFFCPCHNGIFDAAGTAIAGPPAEGGQSLSRYPLRVAAGLLYIEVGDEQLASASTAKASEAGVVPRPCGPPGPGHDPCLYPTSCDKTIGIRSARGSVRG